MTGLRRGERYLPCQAMRPAEKLTFALSSQLALAIHLLLDTTIRGAQKGNSVLSQYEDWEVLMCAMSVGAEGSTYLQVLREAACDVIVGEEDAGSTVSTRSWPAIVLTHWQQHKYHCDNKSSCARPPPYPLCDPEALGSLVLLRGESRYFPPGTLDLWMALNFSFCCHLPLMLSSPWQPKRGSQH